MDPKDEHVEQPAAAPAESPAAAPAESSAERLRRHSHRAGLYTTAGLLVAALVVLVALIVANTQQVKIAWVFGHSHAALVWIVVVSSIAGWVAGIATSLLLHRRTRRPR